MVIDISSLFFSMQLGNFLKNVLANMASAPSISSPKEGKECMHCSNEIRKSLSELNLSFRSFDKKSASK